MQAGTPSNLQTEYLSDTGLLSNILHAQQKLGRTIIRATDRKWIETVVYCCASTNGWNKSVIAYNAKDVY